MYFYRLLFILSLVLLIYSNSQAQSGKTLYEQKCGRCHVAFAPDDYPIEEWPGIVKSMKAQAALTNDDMTQIIDYLVSEGDKEGSHGSSDGPHLGGYLYTEYFQSPEKTKNYDIHYLALHASGWASEKVYYFGEFELEHGGTGGSNTFVEQAYLDFWFTQNIAVKIGAMLTPYNRFDEFHDPLTNFIITRPQVSREIGVSAWKDVGVDLHGYFNLSEKSSIGFDLYSINGLGDGTNLRGSRQYRDNNEDKAFGGRINFMFDDILEIGGSFYNGAWDDDGNYDLTMFGAHVLLHTDIIDIYGEYSNADSENPIPEDEGEISGFFIQGSRLFRNKYRPTVRIGKLDYLDTGTQFGRSASKGNKELTEIAFGFTYYQTAKVAFKLEYTLFKEGGRVIEKDNDQLGMQAAVKF